MAEPERATADTAEPTDAEKVAQRSADVDADATLEHEKVITLGAKPTGDYDHTPNIRATITYAIAQGMRPTGEGRHVSTKKRPGVDAWDLTYAVPVEPAENASGPIHTVDWATPGVDEPALADQDEDQSDEGEEQTA